jgi:hypothetical protein
MLNDRSISLLEQVRERIKRVVGVKFHGMIQIKSTIINSEEVCI